MNCRCLPSIYPQSGARRPLRGRRVAAGFTLVELLIALTVSLVLFAGIAGVFIHQSKGYVTRLQVAAMHQESRNAIGFMARELRMAGYDPTGCACAGIVTATATTLQFTQDLDSDGDTGDANENVTYALYDDGGDGDQDLGRSTGGGPVLVAENVEALTLAYTLADGTTTTTPADLSHIRRVDITLTTRTAHPDAQYSVNNGYRTHQLTETLQVHNLGL